MGISTVNDLRCPKCRTVDTVQLASSSPEKFSPPRQPVYTAMDAPFGAVMLAYLLASLPFLAGNLSHQLAGWPAALSTLGDLLPKPLPSAVIGMGILLVAMDQGTRESLRRLGRAAVLDPDLYRELDAHPLPGARVALSVVLASFGWGVFLGLRSLDSWLEMTESPVFIGTEWVPLAVQGFLAGGLVVLAGWPVSCLVMAYAARIFVEFGALGTARSSFIAFARNLVFPYSLLPLLMGLSLSTGIQALAVLSICWFLASMVMAARHTLNEDTLLALAVTLLGAVPPSLVFFLVTSSVQLRVVDSGWGKARAPFATAVDLESLWLVGVVALAIVLLIIVLSAGGWHRWKNLRANQAWQRAVTRWRRLLYCRRCDGLYLAGGGRLVKTGEMLKLLDHGG